MAWPKRILRTIGAMDLLFALTGFWLVESAIARRGHPLLVNSFQTLTTPHAAQLFWADAVVELLCLIFLALTGIEVLRLHERGLWMTDAVFGFEILRFLAESAAWYALGAQSNWQLSPPLAMLGSATSLQGIAPQIVTGFPIVALMATHFTYHKLRRAKGQAPPSPEETSELRNFSGLEESAAGKNG